MLEEAYKKEIVLAGKSAGAICFGRYYFKSEGFPTFLQEDVIGWKVI